MRAVLFGLVLAGAVLAMPWPCVEAGLIPTASLEDVVAASSHVVLVRHDSKRGYLSSGLPR